MSTERHDLPQEPTGDDLLAGEYVLGVLEAGAHRATAVRIDREPALARAVDAWCERLAPMLDAIEPVEPPLGLWPRIRARLGRDAEQRAPRARLSLHVGKVHHVQRPFPHQRFQVNPHRLEGVVAVEPAADIHQAVAAPYLQSFHD